MILRLCATAMMLLIASNGPALATTSISCNIGDKNVEFVIHGSMGTITGGGITVNEGQLTVKARENWPALTLKVTRKGCEACNVTEASERTLQLGQQWLRDREIRLWFLEPDSNNVDLILQVKLKSEDDGYYIGTYEFIQTISHDRERTYSGQASCWFLY